ncbi:hypothetical protein Neosp_012855 [[Neocosmospora] mangrovei]
MAPTRLGIIGLSPHPGSWAAAAHLPYLLSPHGKAHYKIVALCNSTTESAHSAIKTLGLPSDTRAYGNPSDLAQDANVDLVVCSTRVDRHYITIKPSILAGKAVFVEWPLASNTSQARELASLARRQSVRSMVGLQGPATVPISAARKVLEDGLLGKVLSSEVKAYGGMGNHDTLPESLRFELQRSMVRLASETGVVIETVESDVPNLISVTALLRPSQYVGSGATVIITFQKGQPFPDDPCLTWTISGEKGELKFTGQGGTTPRTMASGDVKIVLHDFLTGEISDIPWAWEPWRQELPVAARGVAGIYEAYARSDSTGYCDFEHGLKVMIS